MPPAVRCLSVLTDKTFFQGGFDVLVEVRQAVELPLLCKEFVLSPYQLFQARAAGADAVLLIAAILTDQDLQYLRRRRRLWDLTSSLKCMMPPRWSGCSTLGLPLDRHQQP